jgi:hypothetical protein
VDAPIQTGVPEEQAAGGLPPKKCDIVDWMDGFEHESEEAISKEAESKTLLYQLQKVVPFVDIFPS